MSPATGGRLPCVVVALRVAYGELARRAPLVRALLSCGERVELRLGPPGAVDLALVDAVARLRLAAGRSPGALRLLAGQELAGLLHLVGLEPQGQAVADEDVLAEEVVDVGDPPV